MISYLALTVISSLYFFNYVTKWYVEWRQLPRIAETGNIPPWAPGGLPLVGNSIALLRDPIAFVLSLRSEQPVRLRLPGVDLFLVQGPENIRTLFRSSVSSNPAYAQQFFAGRIFGMPPKASASFARDNSGISANPRPGTNIEARNRICYRDHEIIRCMLQGRELSDMIQRFSRLLYDKIHDLPIGSQWTEMPDLFDFLLDQIMPLTIELFCGPSLTQVIDPNFVRDFRTFDSWVPAIAKQTPRWIMPQGYRIRDKLLASIRRWRMSTCEIVDDENGMAGCKGMKDKIKLLDVDGWDMDAICASDLGMIWAANSNTLSCLFWMLYEVFRRPSLLAHIQRECAQCTSRFSKQSKPTLDLTMLLNQPYLQSTFAETLRYRCHIFISRYPDRGDMHINSWRLPIGSLVMACSTVAHMQESSWDSKFYQMRPLTQFWPERFLTLADDDNHLPHARQDPTISLSNQVDLLCSGQSPAPKAQPNFTLKGLEGLWIPFGGGSQMCPGQKLAKAQILLAVALIVTHFEFKLSKPGEEMTVNRAQLGTGVAKPAKPLPFRVRVRRS